MINGEESKNVKFVVFVPIAYADAVREAAGAAGAGKSGNYSYCSFSARGIGRFLPETGAEPAIGQVGRLEAVEEERIEFICARERLEAVIVAVKNAHPYEEVAFDIYPLEEISH